MIHGNIDGYEDGMLLEISPTDPLVPNSGLGEGDFFFRDYSLEDGLNLSSDASGNVNDGALHAQPTRDVVEDLDAMDFDVDDFLPELEDLMNEVCQEDLADSSMSGLFDFGSESSTATAARFGLCNHIQNNILCQELPPSISHPTPGTAHEQDCCSQKSCCAAAELSRPASVNSFITPSQPLASKAPPTAPTGPRPLPLGPSPPPMHAVQRFPSPESSSLQSGHVTPPPGHERSPLPSSGSSGNRASRGSTRAVQARAPAGQLRTGVAQKRLRSPERGISPPSGGSSRGDNDSPSPADSSDEGPVLSGHSSAQGRFNPAATQQCVSGPSPAGLAATGPRVPQIVQGPVPAAPGSAGMVGVSEHPVSSVVFTGAPSSAPQQPALCKQGASSGSPASTSTPEGSPAPEACEGGKAEEDQKKAQRMQRNRESALLSRQRKKTMLDELDRRNKDLESQNAQLNMLLGCMQTENASLRALLAQVCLKHGEPLPALPMPGAGMPAIPGVALPYAFAPVMPYAVPMQGVAGSVKLPIQKLAAPARPAPAPKPAPPAKRSRKDTLVAAGKGATSVVMLSLCCLFICGTNFNWNGGVVAPAGNAPFDALPSSSFSLPALPASNNVTALALPASGQGALRVPGNVLSDMHHSHHQFNNTVGSAVSLVHAAWDDVKRQSGHSRGSHGLLQDQEVLALHPNDPEVEKLALKHLKDMGVVAVMSGPSGGAASAPAPWRSFPTMAASLFNAHGLLPPVTCKQVFRIDEEELSDQIAARQKLQQYLPRLQLRGGALALPPIGGLSNEYSQEIANGSMGQNATIGEGKDDGELLVSVVVPAKQDTVGTEAQLTSLDQLLVVVTKPGRMYSTHMCTLQKPILI